MDRTVIFSSSRLFMFMIQVCHSLGHAGFLNTRLIGVVCRLAFALPFEFFLEGFAVPHDAFDDLRRGHARGRVKGSVDAQILRHSEASTMVSIQQRTTGELGITCRLHTRWDGKSGGGR